MKICIIGNSHASALKLAMDTGWSRSDFDIDYMVLPGGGGPYLSRENSRLKPRRNSFKMASNVAGGAEGGVDVANYDAIWVSGVGFNVSLRGISNKETHPLMLARINTWPAGASGLPRITERFMRQLVKSDIASSASWRVCQDVVDMGSTRLVIHPAPRPGAAAFSDETHPLVADYGEKGAGDPIREMMNIGDAMLHELALETDSGIQVARYPDDVLDDGFTRPEYLRKNDVLHVGAEIGAAMLDQMAYLTTGPHRDEERLSEIPAPQANLQ